MHFAFHGCGAKAKSHCERGYNDLAAANDIIMVCPDIKCWDNEGDIDPDGFNTNTGFLPTAIKAMIARVTGGAEEETTEEEGKSEEDEGSD